MRLWGESVIIYLSLKKWAAQKSITLLPHASPLPTNTICFNYAFNCQTSSLTVNSEAEKHVWFLFIALGPVTMTSKYLWKERDLPNVIQNIGRELRSYSKYVILAIWESQETIRNAQPQSSQFDLNKLWVLEVQKI